jgi:cytochrome P450
VYGPLLGRCPVAQVPPSGIPGGAEEGYWGILSYEEVAKAATDFRTFSSRIFDLGRGILPLQADPPQHAHYRRSLNRYFQDAEIAKLEQEVRPFCASMIDAMAAKGEAELVEEFAGPFPTRVLCRLLGLDDQDWELHHDWVSKGERTTGQGLRGDESVPRQLAEKIMPYVQRVIDERRVKPGDDIVSGMVDLEIDGRPLDDIDVCFLMITFMLGGYITTESAIGNLILRVAADRPLQELLRERPDRIGDAIEESLRLDTPQQAMPRRCVQDTEVGGQTIRAGERVLLNYGSANVDPARWERPDAFDLDREDRRHLAFGLGIHMCLAASMARMEMRVALEELLARTEEIAVAGDVRRRFWPRLALEALPLRLRPRR